MILVLFLGQGCDGPIPISDGFFSAIVRADGKIQTNFSTDGLNWGEGFVHNDVGEIDKGVGIATNKAGVMVFLTFFAKDQAGRTKLFVRVGLGNSWESHSPTQISVNAASAPAICRIDDRFFLIAWNNGGGGISTSLLDSESLGNSNAFRLLGDINDTLASQIDGTPSVTAVDNKILLVWRTRKPDNSIDYASNLGTLNPANANVNFGTSSRLNVSSSRGTLTGFPQVSSTSGVFALSISYVRSIGEDLEVRRFEYFNSNDGISWSDFCESEDAVMAHLRPHSITLNRIGQVTELVSGNAADVDGQIMRNCGESQEWNNSSAFSNNGARLMQPAIVFRRGNQP
jgi:hypothetical protein